jgi:hypothetical protein
MLGDVHLLSNGKMRCGFDWTFWSASPATIKRFRLGTAWSKRGNVPTKSVFESVIAKLYDVRLRQARRPVRSLYLLDTPSIREANPYLVKGSSLSGAAFGW